MTFWPTPTDRTRIAATPGERFRVRLLEDHKSYFSGQLNARARDVVKFVKVVPGFQGSSILVYEDATGERFSGVLSYQSVSVRVPLKKQLPPTKTAGRSR